MAPKTAINSDKGLKSPLFSQAVIHANTVYVSGNIGADYTTMKLAGGEVNDVYAQTVSFFFFSSENSRLG
jgi:enamine deaminase RidA (YjgF/YER057c/UK114 family)